MAPLWLAAAPLLTGTGATTGVAATSGLLGTGGALTAGGVLSTTGLGLGAAGLLQAGQATAAQAESAQNIAKFNAQVQKREATARRQRATFEQRRQVKRGARIKSAQIVDIATAGGLGAPVAADLAAEQAAEQELENLLIGFEGEVGAGRALSQAELDRLSGRVAKRRGRAAVTASRIGAGTSLLTGFGKAFS